MVQVIRRKRFSIKFKNFLSQPQIKICDFNHWYIPAALPVQIKYHSTLTTVLNWALGIFHQNQFFKARNYKERLARKLCGVQVPDPVLSQTPFWSKGIWHSSTNTRKSSLEQSAQGHRKHWVFPFWTELLESHLLKPCFLLVLAGIQHPLFLLHSHTSSEHHARSNPWGDKDSLDLQLPGVSLGCFQLLLVCWVIQTLQTLHCWASSSKAAFVIYLQR